MNRLSLSFAPIAAGLVVSVAIPAAASPQPWYERQSCRTAAELAFSTDFDGAAKKLAQLEATRDLDDQACALWVRASYAELQIAVLGDEPKLLNERKRALSRLYGFAKANRAKAARFADLELEARLRRVRVLLSDGQQSSALKESKLVQQMVADRPAAPRTPTLDYVDGVLNAALASPGWAARTFLSLAGLGADKKLGAKALNHLADGNSLYRWDAMYVAHHFSVEVEDAGFRTPSSYSRPLVERFPQNPQFVFDLAKDLWREKKFAESQKIAAPAVTKLDGSPALWSSKIRAKLYWISGRSALDGGNRTDAKKHAQLARAQNFEQLADQIDDLFDDLSS